MIYYEVVEDIGDGYAASRKFRTREEAEFYTEENEGCMNGVDMIDTDAPNFYHDKIYRYIKEIKMKNGTADFILGNTYTYNESEQGFEDIYGDIHYMPHPNTPRDETDGWATSDYFGEV